MMLVARIVAAALVTAALGVGIGLVLFGQVPDRVGICFCLGCLGAIVGAIAGAGREIAEARR